MSHIVRTRKAGEDHQVVTVVSPARKVMACRRTPCEQCPWRKDAVGVFPAEAFKHSAGTAYDMAEETFACHEAGSNKPLTCAGFLLRGAEHNLSVRLALIQDKIPDGLTDNGIELFENYREMAVANGVEPDDPVLALCRD